MHVSPGELLWRPPLVRVCKRTTGQTSSSFLFIIAWAVGCVKVAQTAKKSKTTVNPAPKHNITTMYTLSAVVSTTSCKIHWFNGLWLHLGTVHIYIYSYILTIQNKIYNRRKSCENTLFPKSLQFTVMTKKKSSSIAFTKLNKKRYCRVV